MDKQTFYGGKTRLESFRRKKKDSYTRFVGARLDKARKTPEVEEKKKITIEENPPPPRRKRVLLSGRKGKNQRPSIRHFAKDSVVIVIGRGSLSNSPSRIWTRSRLRDEGGVKRPKETKKNAPSEKEREGGIFHRENLATPTCRRPIYGIGGEKHEARRGRRNESGKGVE